MVRIRGVITLAQRVAELLPEFEPDSGSMFFSEEAGEGDHEGFLRKADAKELQAQKARQAVKDSLRGMN